MTQCLLNFNSEKGAGLPTHLRYRDTALFKTFHTGLLFLPAPLTCISNSRMVRVRSGVGPISFITKLMSVMLLHSVNSPSLSTPWCTSTRWSFSDIWGENLRYRCYSRIKREKQQVFHPIVFHSPKVNLGAPTSTASFLSYTTPPHYTFPSNWFSKPFLSAELSKCMEGDIILSLPWGYLLPRERGYWAWIWNSSSLDFLCLDWICREIGSHQQWKGTQWEKECRMRFCQE